MLTIQTLQTIEDLLTSRSDRRWGELPVLVQIIGEVQQTRKMMEAAQVKPGLAAVPKTPEPPAAA